MSDSPPEIVVHTFIGSHTDYQNPFDALEEMAGDPDNSDARWSTEDAVRLVADPGDPLGYQEGMTAILARLKEYPEDVSAAAFVTDNLVDGLPAAGWMFAKMVPGQR